MGENAGQSAKAGRAVQDQARVVTDGARAERTLEQVGGALDLALHVDAHQLIGCLRVGPGGARRRRWTSTPGGGPL